MKKVKLVALALVASISFAACGSDGAESTESTEAAATETTVAGAMAGDDIVAVASATEGFTTLVAALTAAGLVETLQGAGPFTVFAPSDAAFAALPEGLLEKLLLPENVEVLKSILTYHVVAGKVMSTEVVAGEVPTVEGSSVKLETSYGVKVNGANVTAADVAASNGVIHVIDAVLVPPTVDVTKL